jgi:hypothetical protein
MADINFKSIAARSGSQSNAFEELCCQLAQRTHPPGSPFERFRGAGGDGGVECIARLPDGSLIGWQAKFVFEVDALIAQTTESLRTALAIHKDLERYIVCFPFDPTGKTGRVTKRGRPAKSQSQKINDWIANVTSIAKADGRHLLIECWPAHTLHSFSWNMTPRVEFGIISFLKQFSRQTGLRTISAQQGRQRARAIALS